MYEHFHGLDEEKQIRIINAALREFGRYGYRKTSAEQLAKSAGIAKGMIFHYFGSKQGLFEYLFEYVQKQIKRWWGNLDEELSALDYIEQYRRATKIKLQAYTENPCVFEFLTMIFMHPENLEVSEKAKCIYGSVMEMRNQALMGITQSQNTGLFRDDLDIEKAKRYISWLIEGYTSQLLALFANTPLADMKIDGYWDEFDEIIDDLKKVFYLEKSETED